jgi:hypothetical protein
MSQQSFVEVLPSRLLKYDYDAIKRILACRCGGWMKSLSLDPEDAFSEAVQILTSFEQTKQDRLIKGFEQAGTPRDFIKYLRIQWNFLDTLVAKQADAHAEIGREMVLALVAAGGPLTVREFKLLLKKEAGFEAIFLPALRWLDIQESEGDWGEKKSAISLNMSIRQKR